MRLSSCGPFRCFVCLVEVVCLSVFVVSVRCRLIGRPGQRGAVLTGPAPACSPTSRPLPLPITAGRLCKYSCASLYKLPGSPSARRRSSRSVRSSTSGCRPAGARRSARVDASAQTTGRSSEDSSHRATMAATTLLSTTTRRCQVNMVSSAARPVLSHQVSAAELASRRTGQGVERIVGKICREFQWKNEGRSVCWGLPEK